MVNNPFFGQPDLTLDEFAKLCEQETVSAEYPLATQIEQNIVIYEAATLLAADPTAAKAELARCLKDGPGVFVIKGAYPDLTVIDRTTAAFEAIVAHEKASGAGQGDHFGSNERIWNSLQKLCVAEPELFIEYYGNPLLRLACEAWLGPNYQMTAQMNNVKPGGKAQQAHRDFHLGFQSSETIAQYPAHAQMMSQYLTLQGAIVHCDMPVEKGPTLFLPFSQQFPAGYMTYRLPEFNAYFNEHKVQLPLEKGDMAFFSPALFHGGGNNTTDSDRIANLVQVSSAFGRTMESINNRKMIEAAYAAMSSRATNDPLVENSIANLADGYSFPTNLDSDPPIGGNAPETQQAMLRRALEEGWDFMKLNETLDAYEARRGA